MVSVDTQLRIVRNVQVVLVCWSCLACFRLVQLALPLQALAVLVAHHAVERSTLGDTSAAQESALAGARQELAEAQAARAVVIADHEHAQVPPRLRAGETERSGNTLSGAFCRPNSICDLAGPRTEREKRLRFWIHA